MSQSVQEIQEELAVPENATEPICLAEQCIASKDLKHPHFTVVCIYVFPPRGIRGEVGLARKMGKKSSGMNTSLLKYKHSAQNENHIALLFNSSSQKVENTVLSRICKDKLLFTRHGTEGNILQRMPGHISDIFLRETCV